MAIRPLSEWFYSILTRLISRRTASGTSQGDVSSLNSGQVLESSTSSTKQNMVKSVSASSETERVPSKSLRFLTFISQSIFFETGGDKSGAYTRDPDDRGGETKWGVSKTTHPHLNIKALTYNQAVEIYRTQYWNELYDYILSDTTAFKIFDMGILNGKRTAVKILQKAIKSCGLLVRVDGLFGPLTLTATNNTNMEQLYEQYIKLFDTRFRRLVIRIQSNKKFLRGWLNRLYWKWSTE